MYIITGQFNKFLIMFTTKSKCKRLPNFAMGVPSMNLGVNYLASSTADL